MTTDRVRQLVDRIAFGVTPAMATPLTAAGLQVNLPAVDALVDFLIDAGVKGLFVGGTTGEGILLETSERQRLHEQAMKAIAGRVPALIHVGANTTAESVALATHAYSIGAEAIVAVTPTFYPMPDSALADYFGELAAAAPGTPLLAYDIPHMAVNGVSPALMQRLANDLPAFSRRSIIARAASGTTRNPRRDRASITAVLPEQGAPVMAIHWVGIISAA